MAGLKLNRQQLEKLFPNFEAIKAFENLFEDVRETIPLELDDVQATADGAALQAAEALAGLAQIANALSLALYGVYAEPASQDSAYSGTVPQDTPPQQDLYIPPIALGSMADQNTNNVNITGGSISGVSYSGTNIVSPETHAATSKATPVDADELPLSDSAASFGIKKLTWANLKATLATWIGGNLIGGSFTTLTTAGTVTTTYTGTNPHFRSASATTNGAIVRVSNTSGDSLFGTEASAAGTWATGSTAYATLVGSAAAQPVEIIYADVVCARFTNTGLNVLGTISVNGGATMITSTTSFTNGAGASFGTLTNAPSAGNPTKWISINDNGTTRKIPSW